MAHRKNPVGRLFSVCGLYVVKAADTLVIKSIDRLGQNYDEILVQRRLLTKEKQVANLTLKMEPSQAYGILSALLTTTNAKETLAATCDYFAVFDCMVDILVNNLFE